MVERLHNSEEWFHSLVRNASDVITVLDIDGTIRYDSPAVGRVLGYKPEERIGTNLFDYVHPNDRNRGSSILEKIQANPETPVTIEWRLRHADGSWPRVEITSTNLLDAPDVNGIVVNWRDVTERQQAEERIHFQACLLDAVGQAIIATDLEGKTTYWNRCAEELYGWSAEEVIGRRLAEFVICEDQQERAAEIRTELRAGKSWSGAFTVRRRDGTTFPAMVTDTPVHDERGNLVGIIGVSMDITERKRAEEQLEYQAFHDSLTGLPNRHLFVDRLGQALRHSERRGGEFAVLYLDLDNFKIVNDSLGHEAGDRLLVAVAERLQAYLRPDDTLARFGGDEFAILLEDSTSPTDAIRVTSRITEGLRKPFVLDAQDVYAIPSIGMAVSATGQGLPEELLSNAHTAMYRAKEKGEVDYQVFDPSMDEQSLSRLKLENDLRQAIEGEEFAIHYQPLVNLQTTRTFEVEALVHWKHPERGLVPPSEFIPLAEESGLIVPLGKWVLKESCRQAREWQERYPSRPPLILSVNLSGKQLQHPDMVRTVEQILRETGLEARCLGLDITETVLIETAEGSGSVLERLKGMGVRLNIDDFGTGYSSFYYLKHLPADTLKIDKSLMDGVGQDAQDTAIVQTIVELAHILGLEVVGEGVETDEQAEWLREMGCDVGQGFYFARPLPPDAISQLLGK